VLNLAVIPARGGSKGIPLKNLRIFGGKPLVAWTIEAALAASCIDRVVVSSDHDGIKNLAYEYGVDVHDRPVSLAGDDIHAVYVVMSCLKFYTNAGNIINRTAMLLPTSPLRTGEDIESAFRILHEGSATSVVGVCKSNSPESNYRYIGEDNVLRPIKKVDKYEVQRQDISNPVYKVNGAMFVATREHMERFGSFHEGNPEAYVMNKINSIDINDLDDFRMAEAML